MQRNLYQAYVINKVTASLSAGLVVADNPDDAEIMVAVDAGISPKDLHKFVIVVIHIGNTVGAASKTVKGANDMLSENDRLVGLIEIEQFRKFMLFMKNSKTFARIFFGKNFLQWSFDGDCWEIISDRQSILHVYNDFGSALAVLERLNE